MTTSLQENSAEKSRGEVLKQLEKDTTTVRSELKNIRQQLQKLRSQYKNDISEIKKKLECLVVCDKNEKLESKAESIKESDSLTRFKPVGYIQSLFKFKNGTPRQATVCGGLSRGVLTIEKAVLNNPQHSLEGLEQFSHLWVIFLFHQNNNSFTKAKVKPPRLDGEKIGLFATRCPYRPNAIGLTLAKLEKIEGASVHLSGLDILDGTPVLDIKPYIPEYDQVNVLHDTEKLKHPSGTGDGISKSDGATVCQWDTNTTEVKESKMLVLNKCINGNEPSENCDTSKTDQGYSCGSAGKADETNDLPHYEHPSIATWIQRPPIKTLKVRFTPTAEQQMQKFGSHSMNKQFVLHFLKDYEELKETITHILQADPRSVYRRQNCQDSLYYFIVDTVHVTCWFDKNEVEVLRVQPSENFKLNST